MKIGDLLNSLRSGDGETEKLAAQDGTQDAETLDPETEKLASEIAEAGKIFADSFLDRIEEKTAARATDRASSSHAMGGARNSTWGSVAAKLQKRHGKAVTDVDSGHTRAEHAYPRTIGKSKSPRKGVKNMSLARINAAREQNEINEKLAELENTFGNDPVFLSTLDAALEIVTNEVDASPLEHLKIATDLTLDQLNLAESDEDVEFAVKCAEEAAIAAFDAGVTIEDVEALDAAGADAFGRMLASVVGPQLGQE